MKFPVLSMIITKTMPELSDLMHLEWQKKPPTGPQSGSWWLPRSPFCLCLPACSSPQPRPQSSLQAPALHLLPTGLPGAESCPLCLILPPTPSFLPLMICVPVFLYFHRAHLFWLRLAPLRSTSGRGLPSVRWSILFLLQEWPTFWTLFSASPLSTEICPKQSRGGPALLQVIHCANSEPVGKFSQYDLLLTLMRF